MADSENSESFWKSMAAGAVGGFVASFAMNQFQAAVTAVSESAARKERERKGLPEPEKREKSGEGADYDATVRAANAISTGMFGRELAEYEKKWAGPLVHYGLGTALGAIYGACATGTPIDAGAGTGYGAAVWAGADEIAVPLAGFSGPPTATPLSGHVNALASHLVYGLVTHLTRKLVLS